VKSPFKAGPDPVTGRPRRLLDDSGDMIVGLREQVDRLERAVVSRTVVDQAIGVVMALEGLRPEQALGILTEVSRTADVKLRTVAEQVLGAVQGTNLPEETGRALLTARARAAAG
jgi:hypothetical protein